MQVGYSLKLWQTCIFMYYTKSISELIIKTIKCNENKNDEFGGKNDEQFTDTVSI